MVYTATVHTITNVLAYIGARLGYHPTNAVAVAGIGTSTLGVVDAGPALPTGLARVADHLQERGVTAAFVAIYTDDDAQAATLLDTATEALHGQALDVAVAVHVTASTFRDMLDPQATARDRAEVTTSQIAVAHVMSGAIAPADGAASVLPQPAPIEAQSAAAVAAAAWDLDANPERDEWAIPTWSAAVEGLLTGPAIYGEIAQMLTSKPIRDAVLVSAIPGTPADLPGRMVTEPDAVGDAVGEAMASLLDPAAAVRPTDVTRDAIDLLAQVIAHTPTCAPALTVWALLSWWTGRAGAAHQGVLAALAINPDERLANLLAAALAASIPPGWAR